MIRVEQAIARAKAEGKIVKKKDIAKMLWPDSSEAAQQVNMTKLCNGKLQKVKPEWIVAICNATGCSPDYLIGMRDE